MASVLALFLVATMSTTFGLTVTDCGTLDVPRRLSSAVFDGDDTVYILGGIMENDTAPANPILKYTISSQKVEPLVLPIKPKKMIHGSAAAYRPPATPNEFEIYYIGGGEVYNDTFYDAIYKIRPLQTAGPIIEQVGRLPVGLAASTAHVVTTTNEYEPGLNDWIYIFGGENIMSVDSVYRFGLSDGYETPVATEFHRLNYSLTRAASVLMPDPDPLITIPHQIYFFGGNKNSSGVTLHAEEVLMYDTVGTNTLTGMRLVDAVESPVAVSDGKLVWVIGGYIGGSYSNQRFTEFNITANTAQEVCVTEEYRILPQEASAVYADNKIIIFGGYTNLTTDAILCIDTTALNRMRCPPEDDDSGANTLSSIACTVVLVFLVSVRNNMF